MVREASEGCNPIQPPNSGNRPASLSFHVRRYCPELVLRDDQGNLVGDDGIKSETRFDAVNRGWVSITRPWHLLTTNSGAGYPHAARADKGRRLVEVLVERLAGFLVELSNSPVDERFPY